MPTHLLKGSRKSFILYCRLSAGFSIFNRDQFDLQKNRKLNRRKKSEIQIEKLGNRCSRHTQAFGKAESAVQTFKV